MTLTQHAKRLDLNPNPNLYFDALYTAQGAVDGTTEGAVRAWLGLGLGLG